MWYKLAQANGLSGDAGLTAGRTLAVPAGVMRNTYNAGTTRPYDPSAALGDTSPTTPQPQAAAAGRHGNKCGVFGAILLAVIAIAVVVASHGTLSDALGPVLGGAVGGAAGSVASQVVGLATGIQDRFSFKGVALAAIGGAVGGAIGPGGALGKAGAFGKVGSPFLQGALRGAVSSATQQGIGLATGLQSKFDFAGVAAAGVGGGVASGLQAHFTHGAGNTFSLGERVATGGASLLANAAVRSLIDGTDFGDNILAALPDVIAQTVVGGFLGEKLSARDRLTAQAKAFAAQVAPQVLDDRDSFKAFRGEYKAALEYIHARDAGDTSSATALKLARVRAQLLEYVGANDKATGQDTASGTVSANNDIVVRPDRILWSFTHQMDATTLESYNTWERGLIATRDAWEAARDYAVLWDTLPERRGTALDYLIKAPFLSAYSFVADNVPIAGTAKSAAQIYTGQDVVNGAPVNRAMEGGSLALSLVPFGKIGGKIAAKVGKSAFGQAAERGLLPSGVGGTGAAYNKATGQGLYVLRDELGNVRYIGRGDAPARISTHSDSIDKSELIGEVLYTNNLTKAQAKGLEQRLINEFGGATAHVPESPLLNKINSYSPANPNASLYRDAATEALWQDALKKVGR